jgi:hypothetical protein
LAQDQATSDRLAAVETAAANAQSSADNAWVLVSAALVLMMTGPGLALFYGGLVRSKNMLSLLMHTLLLRLTFDGQGLGLPSLTFFWQDRRIIAHECVHTAQYERLGGFAEFLRDYLHECLEVGYPAGPLEQEAIHKSEQVSRQEK